MNPNIETLIRTALADLEPRIAIARTTIAQAETTAAEAREALAEYLSEQAAYLAALPKPEGDE